MKMALIELPSTANAPGNPLGDVTEVGLANHAVKLGIGHARIGAEVGPRPGIGHGECCS